LWLLYYVLYYVLTVGALTGSILLDSMLVDVGSLLPNHM